VRQIDVVLGAEADLEAVDNAPELGRDVVAAVGARR
jgi:hypothetical protein